MKLLLKTSSSDENWNGDCDFAIVNATPEFALKCLERIALAQRLKQEDSDFCELQYWSLDADYISCSEEIDELYGDRDICEAIEAKGLEIPEEAIQRTECDQIVIYSDGVRFTCYPKHSDVTITSAELTEKFLREIAEGKAA